MSIRPEDALEYHASAPAGKLSVTPTKPCHTQRDLSLWRAPRRCSALRPTKPCHTQRDLSLAYTPGVAVPCLEIARDPAAVYRYTAKGNLVAVVSHGTAVLGLGNIGPAAGKPVMEGKAAPTF